MILYQDSLIVVTTDSITFRNYYLSGRNRVLALSAIEKIIIEKPNFWNGKYRFHGTGNFRTWFPSDYSRNKRDRLFFLHIKNKWKRIGFTSQDWEKTVEILVKQNVLVEGF